MVFSTVGSLIKEDLETKAKNLLERAICVKNGESNTFCAEGNVGEELEFLIKNEYILQKKQSSIIEYEITSKGAEYASG